MRHTDTTHAAEQAQVVAARQLGRDGRMRVAAEMSEEARAISVEGVLRRHPEYTTLDAQRAVFRAVYGDALASACESVKSSG